MLAALALLAPACRPEHAAPPAPEDPSPPAPAPVADPPPGPEGLTPGQELQRQVIDGASRRFLLDLPAGGLLWVRVKQLDADVRLDLYSPDGTQLTSVDRPNVAGESEYEEVPVLGEPAGTYTLEVSPWGDERGGFLLQVGDLTKADPRGRRRVELERLLARANALAAEAGHRQDDGGQRASQRAETAFRDAAAGFAELGEASRQALALHDLGYHLLQDRDRPADAVEPLRSAARLFAAAGEAEKIGHALVWAGRALSAQQRDEEAEAALEEAVLRLQGNGSCRLLATAHNNLGKLLSDRGDAAALDHLGSAFELYVSLGDAARDGRMANLANLGVEYLRRGDLRNAREHLSQAAGLGEELGGWEALRALVQSRLCAVHLAEGRLQEARGCSARALDLAHAAGNDRIRALVRLVEAQVAVKLGEQGAAREAFSEALDLFAGDDQAAGIALNGLGWLALEAGDTADAGQRFRDALPLHRASRDRRARASSLLGLARAERAQGDLEAALATVELSIEVVEEMRDEPTGRTLQARFLASRLDHYDLHVDVLMSLHLAHPGAGWDDRAFLACEAARARSLLDTLADLDRADPAAAAAEVLERLDDLERTRADLVWEGAAEERLAEIDRELESQELALQRLRSRPAARTAAYQAADAAHLRRRAVDDGSLLLSYHLGKERSFVWLTDRLGSEVYPLPRRDVLERPARQAYELLSDGDPTRLRRAESKLRALAAVLLTPVEHRLGGGERLLVAAEGALLYAPFAALPVPSTGRPLVADHEIVILPSATTLAAQRRRLAGRPPADGVVAVMADPVFGPDDPRFPGAKPRVQPPSRRSGESFNRLRHAAEEAAAILDVAPAGKRYLATGFDASFDAVLSGSLSGYRVVHFATHARVSPDKPALSGIVLSRFDAEGRHLDRGELRSRDIYALELPADLVVLSACGTALGEEIRGEGLVGFTQGFFAAGAERLLVSLWAVDDRSTAELMARFYRALYTRNLSPAAALRTAQLAMLQEDPYRSAYHWAGFVLQGEPR